MIFNAYSWYWLADDGRIFASATETVVTATDPDYVAWLAAGGDPTPWPRDAAGNQTDAALQDVLEPYGMFANLSYYTVDARWRKEQGGITLTSGMPILTDDRAQAKINGVVIAANATNITGLVPPGGSGPAFTTQWHAADGSFWHLDAVMIAAMSSELQNHINLCFSASAATITGIANGTITTRDQVDAAFAW